MTALAAVFIGASFVVSVIAMLFACTALDVTRDNSKQIARIGTIVDDVYDRLKNDGVI